MAVMLDQIFRVYFLWIVLSWKCIVCQNANLTASPAAVYLGGTITLTCMYIGNNNETAVTWLNGTNLDFFTLTPGSTVPQCEVFSTVNATFDPFRLHYTCDETGNKYTLTINPVQSRDFGVNWSCTFLDPLLGTTYAKITILERVDSTTPKKPKCDLELGLGLGHGLGIPCVIIGIIVIVIFKYKDCTYSYILGLVLGLGLGITFQVGWIIIASLLSTGNKCNLELGLGLGLSSGMLYGIAIIVFSVIFVLSIFKGIPKRVELGKGILTGLLITSFIGIIVVYLKYDQLKHELTSTTHEDKPPEPPTGTKPEQVPLEPTVKKSKTNNSGAGKPAE